VAEEVLRAAMAIPHGLTALHPFRELDLDGWDLLVRIQLVEPLRDVGDRRPEAAIATFYVVALEAFRDLLGERHVFVLKERCNNQQAFEGAFGWLASESLDIMRCQICAACGGQLVNTF
jgi:hypothetical protein